MAMCNWLAASLGHIPGCKHKLSLLNCRLQIHRNSRIQTDSIQLLDPWSILQCSDTSSEWSRNTHFLDKHNCRIPFSVGHRCRCSIDSRADKHIFRNLDLSRSQASNCRFHYKKNWADKHTGFHCYYSKQNSEHTDKFHLHLFDSVHSKHYQWWMLQQDNFCTHNTQLNWNNNRMFPLTRYCKNYQTHNRNWRMKN